MTRQRERRECVREKGIFMNVDIIFIHIYKVCENNDKQQITVQINVTADGSRYSCTNYVGFSRKTHAKGHYQLNNQ